LIGRRVCVRRRRGGLRGTHVEGCSFRVDRCALDRNIALLHRERLLVRPAVLDKERDVCHEEVGVLLLVHLKPHDRTQIPTESTPVWSVVPDHIRQPRRGQPRVSVKPQASPVVTTPLCDRPATVLPRLSRTRVASRAMRVGGGDAHAPRNGLVEVGLRQLVQFVKLIPPHLHSA
jgi:hypothetical protein